MRKFNNNSAFAISYLEGDYAPKLLAAGHGVIAEQIIDIARDADIPIKKDKDMARVLDKLEPGSYIPEELFNAFAIILAALYQANKNIPGSKRSL